jgi:hypothetical protein
MFLALGFSRFDGESTLPPQAGNANRWVAAPNDLIMCQKRNGMPTALLYPFIALSALGLILSILAHVASWLDLNVPEAAFMLHIGIFVVWIPTVLIANSLTKNHDRKNFWKVVLRGAPKWAQSLMYGIFYYALVNFVLFFLQVFGVINAPDQDRSISEIRFASGHWMAFYCVALVTLYSATQIQKKGLIRKCPNGHEVSTDAAFCEKCGRLLLDEPQ